MIVVHTKTQKEYDELMDILDKKGGCWNCGLKTKTTNRWNLYKDNTCINIDDITEISFSELVYYTKH